MEYITESEAKSLVRLPCLAPNGKPVEVTAVNPIGDAFPVYRAVFRYLEEPPEGCSGMGGCSVDILIPRLKSTAS